MSKHFATKGGPAKPRVTNPPTVPTAVQAVRPTVHAALQAPLVRKLEPTVGVRISQGSNFIEIVDLKRIYRWCKYALIPITISWRHDITDECSSSSIEQN